MTETVLGKRLPPLLVSVSWKRAVLVIICELGGFRVSSGSSHATSLVDLRKPAWGKKALFGKQTEV